MSTSYPEGFFALFKPSGLSSAGALRIVKEILSAGKAGFLGTLDVLAMGVLPVAVGSATKLISFLPPSEKEYVGELVLGSPRSPMTWTGKSSSAGAPQVSRMRP